VSAGTGRPAGPYLLAGTIALLLLVACLVLPWNLEALRSGAAFAEGLERLGRQLAEFTAPDLGAPMLERATRLALETIAVALLGTGLGLLLAYPLALGACG
jgi:ABC-type phosphate/phosphonate transport system permease subunit